MRTLGAPIQPVFIATMPDGRQGFLERDGDRVHPRFQGRFAVPDFDAAPGPRPRVVWLGGSTARGGSDGVPVEGEAAARVARALDVEVLNLGAPGADSETLLALWPEVLPLQPAAVVVQTGHNDLGNRVFGAQGAAVRLRPALERSQLFLHLEQAIRGGAPSPLSAERAHGAPGRLSEAQRAATLARLSRNLDALVARATAAGVAVVLVPPISNPAAPSAAGGCPTLTDDLGLSPQSGGRFVVPANLSLSEVRRRRAQDPACTHLALIEGRVLMERHKAEAVALLDTLRDSDPWPLRAPQEVDERMRVVAEAHGAGFADVDAAARSMGRGLEPPQLFLDNLHLSDAGHALVAHVVAPELARALGVDAAPPPAPTLPEVSFLR
ncbi:MAG: SGNH/GDSL hydrolase family protein [Alphaproteobacteria bacterium]|nr:SGNH/GDSL hydrolase family protein [Alphaproteobacteria bacterium]